MHLFQYFSSKCLCVYLITGLFPYESINFEFYCAFCLCDAFIDYFFLSLCLSTI